MYTGPLAELTKEIAINFYKDNQVSALMPGMKDYISIKNDEGKHIHVQKRLILLKLKIKLERTL